MSSHRKSWPLFVALTLVSAAASLTAQEPPVASADVAALVERLERAEARILELESHGTAAGRASIGLATTPEDELQPVRYDDPVLERRTPAAAPRSTATTSEILLNDLAAGRGVVIPGSRAATMQLSGRIHLDYWAFPFADAGAAVLEGSPTAPVDPQDRFGLRRLRFGARGEISEQVIYRFDLEFPNPPDFEFRDAFIGLEDLPWVQDVLIGNQKRPYGLDAINSTNFNVFLERPTVVEAFNPDIRRLGIQSWNSTDDLRWNWRYGVFNGVNVQNNAGQYIGDAYQLEFAGRLAQTWWWDEATDGRSYGHHALSFSLAHPDGDSPNNTARFVTRTEARTSSRWLDTGQIAGADWYQLLGTEHVLNFGPLQLVGEVQNVWLQREAGSDLHFWGAYGYIAYFLTGEHMAWDRATGQLARIKPFQNFGLTDRACGERGDGWGAWQAAARFSYLDISDRDIRGGVSHQASLALNWYWNSNTRLQFDWEHGWITNQSELAAAGLSEAEYDAIGLRLSVDF